MNKIKSIIYLAFMALILSFNSCDFLNIDDYTQDMYTYDSIFSTQVTLEAYLWGAASALPDEANFFGSTGTSGNLFPGTSASDEAFNPWNKSSHPGTQYVQGAINADNIGGHRFNFWSSMYQIIRKTNIILNNIDKCQDISTIERNRVLGYTYFLRAYSYYLILMNQGPFLILENEVLDANREAEYYNRTRATYDECVEYICAELERAARLMSNDRVQISQFGRPTKGAAYALIARLRLQWASPMFNGGGNTTINGGLNVARQYYGSWTRSIDGVHYINQNYDEKRWAIAAAACKRIIDMNAYELHTIKADTLTPSVLTTIDARYQGNYPNGVGGIDHYKSYAEMFNGEGVPYQNKEFIWARWSTSVRAQTQHVFPVSKGGYGGMAVPQKIIDAYYMNDGTDCPYGIGKGVTTEKLVSDSVWSGYRLSSGRVSMMYVNREPRFYASIGFQGCYWPMSSVTSTSDYTDSQRYFDYTRNGIDGFASTQTEKNDFNMTGYASKKYVHPDDAWRGTGNKRTEKSFPLIRYAEILISYAEALNNLTATHTVKIPGTSGTDSITYTVSRNEAEIEQKFNLIRFRAGLPGVTAEQLADPIAMQNVIERERMVEFFNENRRFFDVRRWGKYETAEKEPIYGMNVEKDGDQFYEIVQVNHSTARERVVARKMIFLPLSTNELKKVPYLDQNYGW